MRDRVLEATRAAAVGGSADRCWFCGASAVDENDYAIVVLYDAMSVQRGAWLEWRQFKVKVPRCGRCSSAHLKEVGRQMLGALGGLLVGGIAAFAASQAMGVDGLAALIALGDTWSGVGGWALMILLLLAGFAVGCVLGWSWAESRKPAGVAPEQTKRDYPVVKDLLDHGYCEGRPPRDT